LAVVFQLKTGRQVLYIIKRRSCVSNHTDLVGAAIGAGIVTLVKYNKLSQAENKLPDKPESYFANNFRIQHAFKY